MNTPYTIEVITIYRATTLDGKHVGEGRTEEEAYEALLNNKNI